MPVDYAEPKKLADFKIEVIPANSNNPIVEKKVGSNIFTPTTNIVPNSRNSDLGKPSNLPSTQQNLRSNGQYRTISLVPVNRNDGSTYYSNTPLRRANNQLQTIRSNGTGLNTSASFARDEAFAELAYQSGFFLDGVIDGIQGKRYGNDQLRIKRLPMEDLSYNLGNRAGDQARNITRDAKDAIKKTRDDIWRNRPTFEIPNIKLPDFQLPDFELPKFPDFKFPEISFPKPKPIPPPKPSKPQNPKSLKEQILDLPPADCGGSLIKAAYPRLVTREYIPREDGLEEVFGETSVSVDFYLKHYLMTYPEDKNLSIEEILDQGQGTGFIQEFNGFTVEYNLTNYVGLNGDINPQSSQYLLCNSIYIFVDASTKYSDVIAFADRENPSYIYDFSTSKPYKEGCFIPEYYPPPSPPPPEPPEKDCCRMGCCPKPTEINYRLIKRLIVESLKEQKFNVDVPVVTCEFNQQSGEWEAKTGFTTMEFFAPSEEQAVQQAQLHIVNAIQAADLCLARNKSDEAIAAIPLSWQIRHEGGKPQMVIQCAERKENGKYGSAMYPITVPHWKGGQNDKPSLPPYRKGNYEGILVLADNTKVTVNAANQAECNKVFNAIKPWIKKEMLTGSYFKGGIINAEIKNTLVKPMYGRYFSTGQKNNKPDWRVDFP